MYFRLSLLTKRYINHHLIFVRIVLGRVRLAYYLRGDVFDVRQIRAQDNPAPEGPELEPDHAPERRDFVNGSKDCVRGDCRQYAFPLVAERRENRRSGGG